MKYAKRIALILTLATLLTLCACGNTGTAETSPAPEAPTATEAPAEQPVPGSITVTDGIGREVEVLPGCYGHVVCIGAGALRLYSYVGDTSYLCGVEDIDNITLTERPKMFDSVARPYVLAYGDVFAALPSCGVGGPNAQTAEAEKILSCHPDIVISQYEDVEKADALQEQLGVPVITVTTGPDGVFSQNFTDSITLLGQVFFREDRAARLNAYVAAQTRELQERTAGVAAADRPGVYVCGLGNWGTTNHLMTSQRYKPFEIANIRNAVTGLDGKGVQALEEEKFVSLGSDMDILLMDAAAIKNIAPLYAEDPTLFDTCKAVGTGDVYLQMAYNAYYTNHEIALANAWFAAKTVYPELFGDVDMTAKLNEITEMFLGKPLAEEIFACPGSFGGYQKVDIADFFK